MQLQPIPIPASRGLFLYTTGVRVVFPSTVTSCSSAGEAGRSAGPAADQLASVSATNCSGVQRMKSAFGMFLRFMGVSRVILEEGESEIKRGGRLGPGTKGSMLYLSPLHVHVNDKTYIKGHLKKKELYTIYHIYTILHTATDIDTATHTHTHARTRTHTHTHTHTPVTK